MSDSNQSCEHGGLLTVESMPRQPRLYNIDRHLGPVVRFYVLGYPMTSDALIEWADRNAIEPNVSNNNRRRLTWQAICKKLPRSCRRWAGVTIEEGPLTNCIVLATNGSLEEMQRAEDFEMIRAVQKVLQVDTPPMWHKVVIN